LSTSFAVFFIFETKLKKSLKIDIRVDLKLFVGILSVDKI
jgi:hypothetical protein